MGRDWRTPDVGVRLALAAMPSTRLVEPERVTVPSQTTGRESARGLGRKALRETAERVASAAISGYSPKLTEPANVPVPPEGMEKSALEMTARSLAMERAHSPMRSPSSQPWPKSPPRARTSKPLAERWAMMTEWVRWPAVAGPVPHVRLRLPVEKRSKESWRKSGETPRPAERRGVVGEESWAVFFGAMTGMEEAEPERR